MKTRLLILCLILSSNINAQTITNGIYTSSANDGASTYIEVNGDVLKSVYAEKYESSYNRIDSKNFKNNTFIIEILSTTKYKITNIAENRSSEMFLQIALPKFSNNDIEVINTPHLLPEKMKITSKISFAPNSFNIVGNYKYDGSENVVLQINADGTGKFQYSPNTNPTAGNKVFDIRWAIKCNDNNQYSAYVQYGVLNYTLMIYTNKWEALALQYNPTTKRIAINRDRYKD